MGEATDGTMGRRDGEQGGSGRERHNAPTKACTHSEKLSFAACSGVLGDRDPLVEADGNGDGDGEGVKVVN